MQKLFYHQIRIKGHDAEFRSPPGEQWWNILKWCKLHRLFTNFDTTRHYNIKRLLYNVHTAGCIYLLTYAVPTWKRALLSDYMTSCDLGKLVGNFFNKITPQLFLEMTTSYGRSVLYSIRKFVMLSILNRSAPS